MCPDKTLHAFTAPQKQSLSERLVKQNILQFCFAFFTPLFYNGTICLRRVTCCRQKTGHTWHWFTTVYFKACEHFFTRQRSSLYMSSSSDMHNKILQQMFQRINRSNMSQSTQPYHTCQPRNANSLVDKEIIAILTHLSSKLNMLYASIILTITWYSLPAISWQ